MHEFQRTPKRRPSLSFEASPTRWPFFVAALAGSVLVRMAPGTTPRWGAAVYVASLMLLFGVSALYHQPAEGKWR